jgi:hypothetical protein
MNLNGLLNMLTKMFIRHAVDAGVKYAAGKGKPEAEMTPEELAQAKRGRELVARAQEVSKVTRRLWR